MAYRTTKDILIVPLASFRAVDQEHHSHATPLNISAPGADQQSIGGISIMTLSISVYQKSDTHIDRKSQL